MTTDHPLRIHAHYHEESGQWTVEAYRYGKASETKVNLNYIQESNGWREVLALLVSRTIEEIRIKEDVEPLLARLADDAEQEQAP